MYDAITIIFAVATVFLLSLALYIHSFLESDLYKSAVEFGGPPGYPVIGNALSFTGSTIDIINTVVKWMDTYPSPFRVWLGNQLFVLVYEPDQLKAILFSSDAIDKPHMYNFFAPWLGNGLFTAPGEIWRPNRKLIAPTFNNKILESFVEIFEKQALIMAQQMEKELGRGEFDVLEYVGLCTLDMICETTMGVELHTQAGRDDSYVRAVGRMFEIVWQRGFKVWLHPEMLFKMTELSQSQNECLKNFHHTTERVIRQKKAEMERKAAEPEFEGEKSRVKRVFLDLLMELSSDGKKLTERQLRDEINTMTAAGNDTTAIVDTFVMFILANFPDIQDKVFAELCEIYGDQVCSPETRPMEHADLARMEYLDRVIKETMRMFPVVAMFLRVLRNDIDIGDGNIIRKGSYILIPPIKIHRWEKIWPDPMKFDPDRFLPEQTSKRHPYAYIPFSSGPRSCVGMRYAMLAMKTLLATIVRCYVLVKDEPIDLATIQLKPEISLKTVEPLKIKIRKRQK